MVYVHIVPENAINSCGGGLKKMTIEARSLNELVEVYNNINSVKGIPQNLLNGVWYFNKKDDGLNKSAVFSPTEFENAKVVNGYIQVQPTHFDTLDELEEALFS